MRYKTIATIAASLTFLNAILFLVFPEFSLALLERPTNPIGVLNTRISGACALGLGTMTWLFRSAKSADVQRVVCVANLTTFGILVFVDFHGLMVSAVNELGWLIFLADLMLFLGFLAIIYTSRGEWQ